LIARRHQAPDRRLAQQNATVGLASTTSVGAYTRSKLLKLLKAGD
jgi:hypothetical protein